MKSQELLLSLLFLLTCCYSKSFPQKTFSPNTKRSAIDNSTVALNCPSGDIIIESPTDLNKLGHCNNVLNNFVVTANYQDSVINLRNINCINGNFIIENATNLVKIVANDLTEIKGNFVLTSLTSLNSLEILNLTKVNSIDWKILPILTQIYFNENIFIRKNIIISDTSISEIIKFKNINSINILNINNNRFLEKIDINLQKVDSQLSVHANSQNLVFNMPYLQEAENITIRDTAGIDLPSLTTVSSNLEIIENYIPELKLPNLNKIGGTLGIIDNKRLRQIDLNNLTDIQGGLLIENNSNLKKIDFFKNLKTIGGAISIIGDFTDTIFSSLKLVKGSVYLNSKSQDMDCNKWITLVNSKSIVRGGKIKCISPRKQNLISLDENGKIIEINDSATSSNKVSNSANISISNNGSNSLFKLNLSWIILVNSIVNFFI